MVSPERISSGRLFPGSRDCRARTAPRIVPRSALRLLFVPVRRAARHRERIQEQMKCDRQRRTLVASTWRARISQPRGVRAGQHARGGTVRTSRLIVTLAGAVLTGVTLTMGLLGSPAAIAAPWQGGYCVVAPGMMPNCRFEDESSCARAAVAAGAGCVARNALGARPIEPLASAPKNAGFCLVTAGDSKCNFYDAQSCAKAAQMQGGTCITRPKLSSPTT